MWCKEACHDVGEEPTGTSLPYRGLGDLRMCHSWWGVGSWGSQQSDVRLVTRPFQAKTWPKTGRIHHYHRDDIGFFVEKRGELHLLEHGKSKRRQPKILIIFLSIRSLLLLTLAFPY